MFGIGLRLGAELVDLVVVGNVEVINILPGLLYSCLFLLV